MFRHRGYNHIQSQKEPDGQNEQETTKSVLYWKKKEFNPLGGQFKTYHYFFFSPSRIKTFKSFLLQKTGCFHIIL